MSKIKDKGIEMAEAVTVARPRAVTVPTPPGITPAEILRAELRKAVRSAWDLPEAQQMKDALRVASKEYAEALRVLYQERGIADQIKAIARRLRLGEKYRMAWGKV